MLSLAACAEAQPFEPSESPAVPGSSEGTGMSDGDGGSAEPTVLPDPLVLPTPEGDVMFIDGEAVPQDEFYYQLVSLISAYEYYVGESIDWDEEIEGQTANDFFLAEAAESVIRFRAIERGAQLLGVDLSEEELDQIEQDIETQIEDVGGREVFDAALASQALTEDTYRYLIYLPQLYYKMYEADYGDGGEYAPAEQDVEQYYSDTYMTAQHIMVALFDDEGEVLSFADQQAAMERLEEAREKALAGEDFYELMQEYSEDEWMTTETITFTDEMMPPEYSDTVAGLEYDGISDIFQIEDMLVFIKRLPLDGDYYEEYHEELYDEYAMQLFDERILEWADTLDVEYTDVYEQIDVQAIYGAYFGA